MNRFAVVIFLFAGCAAPDRLPPASNASPAPDRPAALVNGQPITYGALRPGLLESAGGLALREAVLDVLLEAELSRSGQAITEDEVVVEGRHLAEAMLREADIGMAEADRVLASIRQSRGLGEHRYAALLRRTAKLRRLVAGSVTVTDDEVAEAFRINHGPRTRARIITTAASGDAAAMRERIVADPAQTRARFIEAATVESTDPSADRGGLLEPINHADPSYPIALRQALAALAPGDVSPIIVLERGFAVALCEEQWPGDDADADAEAPRARAAIRLRKERLAMDREAQRLLDSAQVSILDRSLDWSYGALKKSQPR